MSYDSVQTEEGSTGNDGYSTTISLVIPINLLKRIEDFGKRNKTKRSDAIRQLLETALVIEQKVGMVETWSSQDLEDIREQLESGQLVDWVSELPRDRFNTIIHILTDEEKRRGKKK